MTTTRRQPRRLSTILRHLVAGTITEEDARAELVRGGWAQHNIDFWISTVIRND